MHLIRKWRAGRVIYISSISGVIGIEGQANYMASKSAVIGFAKVVVKEYGKYGMMCNAVALGYIETDMPKDLSDERKLLIILCSNTWGVQMMLRK